MPLRIQFAKNFTLFISEFLAPMLQQDSDLSGSILFSQKLIRPMILKFKREISYCAQPLCGMLVQVLFCGYTLHFFSLSLTRKKKSYSYFQSEDHLRKSIHVLGQLCFFCCKLVPDKYSYIINRKKLESSFFLLRLQT